MTIHEIRMLVTVCVATAAALGCLYSIVSSLLMASFFRRPLGAPAAFPAVTVIRPLHGREHALVDNLSSFLVQDYPGPVQFLFGVHDAHDPALEAVEAIRARYPHADVTVVADTRLHGPNRKISNIVNMLAHAKHAVFVFADSDVHASPDTLRHVVATLEEPDVGLVSCLFRGQPDPGFWPRVSAAACNYHFVPSVVIGLVSKLARPCFGPMIAMRRDTLERIGGLTQFSSHLAEDHAIGEAVRAIGLRVEIPPFIVTQACVETTSRAFVHHELRASRTIRRITPQGHLGSVITYPFALALIAMLLAGAAPWSLVLLGVALLSRLHVGIQADRALGRTLHGLAVLPLCELMLFYVFIASFRSSRVVWRGHRFSVDDSGLMTARK
ncbi:bacteriohopanetetrol glucosamine biosynthesis glycosyltransferase HpnI [Pararobbsia silviterrae]|uniref:Glycosyltransferase n=1 Tax=Pararobbsia silviterrae TaxID=1792498 RepID=A0A494XG34_9BURK|nr:bacteriohopanetetrol glucosamine biosynthesis glycosyltransferase HpnI [Pararobbsia silviterrae]RKP49717.1 glycosyltransferase [Pararobbsia silviterrae]